MRGPSFRSSPATDYGYLSCVPPGFARRAVVRELPCVADPGLVALGLRNSSSDELTAARASFRRPRWARTRRVRAARFRAG